MAEVRSLLTFLGYRYDNTGIKKAEQDVNTYKSGLLGIVAVSAATVAAFAKSVLDTVHFGEELELTSQKLGIGAEQLQEFQFAAGQVGLSTEKFSSSLGILSKNLIAAQTGSKSAVKAFSELGINPKGFKDSSDLIFKIADKFAALPNSYKKTGIARELFGRGGLDFIPFLNLGADRIRELGTAAKNLGVVMSNETVKSADDASDSIYELQYIVKALQRSIGAQFVPALYAITKGLTNWLEANSKLIGSGIKSFFQGVAAAASFLFKSVQALAGGIELLLKPFGGLEKYIKFLTGPFGFLLIARLVTGLVPLFVGAFGGVTVLFGSIVVAITSVILVIQDLFYFLEGKPSLIGDIFGDRNLKDAKEFKDQVEKIYEFLKKIADITIGGIAKFIGFSGGQTLLNQDAINRTRVIPRSERDYEKTPQPASYLPAQQAPSSNKQSFVFNIPINVSGNGGDDTAFDKVKEGIQSVIEEHFAEQGYTTDRNFLPQTR